MLMIYNKDRPGVIGTVGRVLGGQNVNIARMQCARSEKGENALLIIGLVSVLLIVSIFLDL